MQTILITGVSRGIGHALATHWLDAGARVIGMSRSTPADLVEREGFTFKALDLSDLDAAARVGAEVVGELGDASLDLVVLNAGMLGPIGDLTEVSTADMEAVTRVNLWANKALLDPLLTGLSVKQVVGVSTGVSTTAMRGWAGYSISKAALNMMMALYATERADTHFTALAPGIIMTEMQRELDGLPPDERFDSLEWLRDQRPTMLTPEQAAPGLAKLMAELPGTLPSGGFTDARLDG